jgi:hypothetical protein
LLYSPRWLFIYPGLAAIVVGAVGVIVTEFSSPLAVHLHLGVDTLAVSCALIIVGAQALIFGVLTKIYGIHEGYLPKTRSLVRLNDPLNMEVGVFVGAALILVGIAGLIASWIIWERAGFGALNAIGEMRKVLPAMTLAITGCQIMFASFFIGIMQI